MLNEFLFKIKIENKNDDLYEDICDNFSIVSYIKNVLFSCKKIKIKGL